MSFTDRLVLWLHIAFAIFTIGPISAAIMSTPRYIRTRNIAIVRYLRRMTQIFGLIALGVLVFGIILGQQLDVLAKPWLTASLTLFVVSIALLVIIVRDQRRAITALEKAAAQEAPGIGQPAPAGAAAVSPEGAPAGTPAAAAGQAAGSAAAPGSPDAPAQAARHIASVERGRITTMGAVVTVIWLVILVLMVWR
jgi:Predicted integral membrane protein (DUF2269)